MLASRTRPAGFVLAGTLMLAGNRALVIKLNLLAVPWVAVCFVGTGVLGALVRPQGWAFSFAGVSLPWFVLALIGGIVATFGGTLVLHEAVHGLMLWVFTRSRPVFGFKGWYVYTDAPGWYLSRGPMLAALAAPLVLLPVLGAPVVAFAPAGLSLFVLFGLWGNAMAAIGDVYLMVFVLRIRGPVVFGDEEDAKPGEGGSWYVPGAADAPL